jgi:hypothetical protein
VVLADSQTDAMTKTQSPDTEPWAEAKLFEYWRGLQTWEKAEIVTDLCKATEELSLAGLAARHPDASEQELHLRAACLRLGRETVEQVLGGPLPFEDSRPRGAS